MLSSNVQTHRMKTETLETLQIVFSAALDLRALPPAKFNPLVMTLVYCKLKTFVFAALQVSSPQSDLRICILSEALFFRSVDR